MTDRPDPFEHIEQEIRDLETKASERSEDPLVHLHLGAACSRKYHQAQGHEDNVAADRALHHLRAILDGSGSAATLRAQAALLGGQLLCYERRYGECFEMIELGRAELSGATDASPDVPPELELVGGVLEIMLTGDLPLRLACVPGHAWTVRGRAGTRVTVQDRAALTVRSWQSLRKSSVRAFQGTDMTRISLTQALQDLGLENEPDQLDFLAAAMEKAATSGPELLFRWQGRAGGKDRFVPALLYEQEASDLAVVTILNGDGVVEFVDLLPVNDAPGRLLTRLLAVSFSELCNLVREASTMARATEIFFLLAPCNFHGHTATLDAGDVVALQPRGGNWEASSWKPGHGSRFAPLGRIAPEGFEALRQETRRFYDLQPMIEAYEAARLRRAGQSRELFPSERQEAGRTLSLSGGHSLPSRKKQNKSG